MSVTLSCDHRVIDGVHSDSLLIYQFIPVKLYAINTTLTIAMYAGAIGAEWLKAFKGYIENPESMLL